MPKTSTQILVLSAIALTLTSCSFFSGIGRGLKPSLESVMKEDAETFPLTLTDVTTIAVNGDVGRLRVFVSNEAPHLIVTRRFTRPTDLSFQRRTVNGVLEISTRVLARLCPGCQTDLELRIPPGLRLKLRTDVGDIEVRGAVRDLEAHADTGSVRVSRVGLGRVNLSADSGSLDLSDASGELRLETSSGSITLKRASGALQAKADSGDITISQLRLNHGTASRVVVDSGSIALNNVAAEDGLFISGQTDTGGLSLLLEGFTLERHVEESGALAFSAQQTGQRKARLELRVDSGDIQVQSRW